MDIKNLFEQRLEELLHQNKNKFIGKSDDEILKMIGHYDATNVEETLEAYRLIVTQDYRINKLRELCKELGRSGQVDEALIDRAIHSIIKE